MSKIKRPKLLALALALMLGVLLVPASAMAAPTLHWSLLGTFDATGGTPTGVSCASESLCAAIDSRGNAFGTSDATASSPTWNRAEIDAGGTLSSVSCAPSGLCVAVDNRGRVFASTDPAASTWSPASVPNGGKALTGVSCPSASLCVAVDAEGDVATSTDPIAGVWTLASTHPGHDLDAVSCASPTLCVAVDSAGDALASASPSGGTSAWSEQHVDSEELLAVSCWAAGACLAVDRAGAALASGDPLAKVALVGTEPPTPAATWSLTPIDGERLAAASCASTGVCVAVDDQGGVRASDDPTAAIPTWSASSPDTQPLTAISCLAGGLCIALDTAGRAFAARVPAPQATTEKAIEVTGSNATLVGTVDPNDAALSGCTFEYGLGEAGYAQSAPCTPQPNATGGVQAVSAPLAGLLPNTTYHYRLSVSSPQGIATGTVESFTTPTSSQVALVHPSPSISGTPANGQRLTCHAGLPAGAAAQLTYAWLRDQIAIQGAIASTYTVKGQDSGHHLQCEVTATDGGGSASAKSAFVTIPVGGVPASAGETTVGRASFKSGRVSVPVACSAQASGDCQLTLRLTAVETLSAGRVVAIAARTRRPTHAQATNGQAEHGRAAAASQRTITLADVRVRVAPGIHTAVGTTLATSAKRLLASAHRFTAALRVSGTVIGVIEAQLAQQVLTLTAPPRRASSHASRRR
jgi:hypothetical protein